jgi:hypothetical protein
LALAGAAPFFEELQLQAPDLNLVAVRQGTVLGTGPVDPHAIAPEVLDPEPPVLFEDAGVLASARRAIYPDRARAPAHGDGLMELQDPVGLAIEVLELGSHGHLGTLANGPIVPRPRTGESRLGLTQTMVTLPSVRRSSTLLSRLALALLVALGFVAPQVPVEADRVVQFAPGAPTPLEAQPAIAASALALRARPCRASSGGLSESPERSLFSARYLLYRAWLL